MIGSIGWIKGTSCEYRRACYPTRAALTCAADETPRVVMRSLSVFRALPSDQARK